MLKIKISEITYQCCVSQPRLIQMDVSGPLGGRHKEESWWGAECCKVKTFLVPEQRTRKMPAPVKAFIRSGLWAMIQLSAFWPKNKASLSWGPFLGPASQWYLSFPCWSSSLPSASHRPGSLSATLILLWSAFLAPPCSFREIPSLFWFICFYLPLGPSSSCHYWIDFDGPLNPEYKSLAN